VPAPTDYRRSKATVLRSRTTEPRRSRQRSAIAVSLTLLALWACGGDELLLPSSGEPALITAVSGSNQTGTVGQPLTDSLVVRVTDPEDRAVAGVEVVFVGPADAVFTPNDTVLTRADGTAAVHYTLPTSAGQQTIEARAKPVVPTPSLTTTFIAVAQPEPAVRLVVDGGDKQEGELQAALDDSLAVKALDRFGNGVPGVEVSWEAEDGSVSPQTVPTGADGRAATQRTLGTRAGLYRTSAVAAGLEGSPVEFEATGLAPPSPQLVLITQPSSSAPAGVQFDRQPVIQLQDALGAPLARADVAVTVQIAEGGGSLGGTTTARSNAEGRVVFTNLSVRGRPGTRNLLFAAADFTPATSEGIEVTVGPAASGPSSASAGNGTAGTATTVSIHLEDQFGTAVEDAAGSLTVRIEGANPGDAAVTELGGGDYSASYTPTVAGTDQITVQVNGDPITGSPLSSVVSPGRAAASQTTAQVTRAGGFFFEITILVTARDAHGNLVAHGGDRVQLRIDGSDVLRDMRDNGDGTYSDRFVIVQSNPRIFITLNGDQISGSPYGP
jgi:hypothetical protein